MKQMYLMCLCTHLTIIPQAGLVVVSFPKVPYFLSFSSTHPLYLGHTHHQHISIPG